MDKEVLIKSTLTKLAELLIELHQKGGPSADGHLFEETYHIQNDILISFGLPENSVYQELLWFDSLPTEIELDNRINQLHEAAKEYLLSNTKSDLRILIEAQENNQDSSLVLPELKVLNHTYTIFVYDKILLKGKDTVENVLEELRFVDGAGILGTIEIVKQAVTPYDGYTNPSSDLPLEIQVEFDGKEQSLPPYDVIDILKEMGVKYIDQFIISNSNLLSDDDY